MVAKTTNLVTAFAALNFQALMGQFPPKSLIVYYGNFRKPAAGPGVIRNQGTGSAILIAENIQGLL